jgi:haloalkane dehalogenase
MPYLNVLESTIHYREMGEGGPIVLLHGNPASSHMWRNVLPHIGTGRLLAPDLIGMGASGKPDIDYQFADHADYLAAWFDELELDDVVLVGHDWGGALAFDWAARHPDRVAGVAFFESVIRPLTPDEVPAAARERTALIRTHGEGERSVLEENAFVTAAFTGGVLTPVPPDDLAAHLAPFPTPETRRPVLAWARQFPIGDTDPQLAARLVSYQPWLATSEDIPKLLITFAAPRRLLAGAATTIWCRDHIAGLQIVHGGEAGHHAAEDQPTAIGQAISGWLDRNYLR